MIDTVENFFDTDDFAEVLTYTNTLGIESPIKCIFNEPFHVVSVGDIEYMSKDPSVVCKTSDVADADTSTTITRGVVVYNVREVQPDGTGVTILILSLD